MKKWMLFLVLLSGCGPMTPFFIVPMGVDVYLYWKDGEARKYYKGDAEQVFDAIKNITKDLEHTVSKDEKDKDGGHIYVTHSDNHQFQWYIAQYDPKIVIVKCRIDVLGDKQYVQLIYQSLDKVMGVKNVKIIDESVEKRWSHFRHAYPK